MNLSFKEKIKPLLNDFEIELEGVSARWLERDYLILFFDQETGLLLCQGKSRGGGDREYKLWHSLKVIPPFSLIKKLLNEVAEGQLMRQAPLACRENFNLKDNIDYTIDLNHFFKVNNELYFRDIFQIVDMRQGPHYYNRFDPDEHVGKFQVNSNLKLEAQYKSNLEFDLRHMSSPEFWATWPNDFLMKRSWLAAFLKKEFK